MLRWRESRYALSYSAQNRSFPWNVSAMHLSASSLGLFLLSESATAYCADPAFRSTHIRCDHLCFLGKRNARIVSSSIWKSRFAVKISIPRRKETEKAALFKLPGITRSFYEGLSVKWRDAGALKSWQNPECCVVKICSADRSGVGRKVWNCLYFIKEKENEREVFVFSEREMRWYRRANKKGGEEGGNVFSWINNEHRAWRANVGWENMDARVWTS